ncbi:ABC transporter permease [Lentisalinibacter salinarum]|uniref:ABC transporter permease n=1 Tax=Lentisalinibacter salinarum TaxID=2992239 RepID=UPI00386DD217
MSARFPIARLALRSIASRRTSAALTCCAVALSVLLVLGVQEMRESARQSFASTISGTDLLVGPRTSGVNLLLYAVFRIGQPTNNVSWQSYERFAAAPGVDWSIPLSLGDSYRGHAVVGTTDAYFRHFRYGRDSRLQMTAGRAFGAGPEAVLGATAARELGHEVGGEIVIAHGLGATSFLKHDRHPVTVTGILAPTGTVADRAVYVSLATLGSIHEAATPSFAPAPADDDGHGHVAHAEPGEPADITAFLLGLESRVLVLRLQRTINEYEGEPLTAVIPAVALFELWSVIGVAENALLAVGALAVLTGLVGMLVAILGTLNERRREMAILRSVGARPRQIFLLLVSEAGLLAVAGALLGVVLKTAVLGALASPIQARTGILLESVRPGGAEAVVVAVVTAAGLLLGALPAWRAYRNSLADGMTIRL